MQIAIGTNSLNINTPAALERAAALGFAWVEINLQSAEFFDAASGKPNLRFYRELRIQLDTLGLSVWSVTTPPLTSIQQASSQTRKDMLLAVASAAGALAAQVVVTEPGNLFSNMAALTPYFAGTTAPPVIDGYDDVWVQIVNRRMKLALRNTQSLHGAGIDSTQHMAKVTRDLAIFCALDVRHALDDAPLDVWVGALRNRIAVAHAANESTIANLTDVAAVTDCLVLSGTRNDSAELWHSRLEKAEKTYGQ